jgi:lipopolysaccharide transport system ATP-binding protein
MTISPYIKIEQGYVEGIDTSKRALGLKHFLMGKGKIISSAVPILNDINFACYSGEKIAFIGNNGSGKSSLLKAIAGIYPLKSGRIDTLGKIAAAIEMGAGFEYEMTGRQNIKSLMLYNNTLENYSKSLEKEVIEFSELGDKIDVPIKYYSSGMLSRLAFSAMIFQEPDILLLDEVFAAGDQHFVQKSLEHMRNKFKTVPISILVSHQESIIKENCHRCLLLKNGSIVADGKTEEVFEVYNSGNY